MSYNRVTLIGHIGQDPDWRTLSSGTSSICSASLATSERYTNQKGEKVQKTQWHKLVIWNKYGETFYNLVKKGWQILIEGKVEYENYTDKSGEKRYVTKIVVDKWNIISSPSKDSSSAKPAPAQAFGNPTGTQAPMAPLADEEDDLPF